MKTIKTVKKFVVSGYSRESGYIEEIDNIKDARRLAKTYKKLNMIEIYIELYKFAIVECKRSGVVHFDSIRKDKIKTVQSWKSNY